MNIVIAGGQTKADFLISMFKKGKHNLVVINDDDDYADFLSKKYQCHCCRCFLRNCFKTSQY